MSSWIETADLCRYYRRGEYEVRALDRVNIRIEKGEFVAVVGKSGSGKSTLLNLLGGLDTPTSGQILIEGRSLGEYSRRELAAYRANRVGMIFQSFNLLPHRPAFKNVELALYFNQVPRRERRERTRVVLDKLGLSDRVDHHPPDLSGGEQQRVAVARALVKSPELLCADEPTGNLDQENSELIAELLSSLNRDGLTVVMVTHDLDLARKSAGRIVKMDYGKIVEE
jgi:putative ABC transport system ATP-binding protein